MAAWRAHPHNMCASGRLECAVTKLLSSVLSRFEFAAPCARLCKNIWFTCVMSLKARCQSRPARFNLPGPSTSCDTFVCVHCRWQLFPTKGFRTHLLPAESKSRCSYLKQDCFPLPPWTYRVLVHRSHETRNDPADQIRNKKRKQWTKVGHRGGNLARGKSKRIAKGSVQPQAATCNLQTQEIKDLTCLDAPPLSTHYAAFGTHVGTQAATKGCLWSFSSQRYLVCI